MEPVKVTVIVVGEVCDVLGILLVGSPELTFYGKQTLKALKHGLDLIVARLASWFGRERSRRGTVDLSSHAVPQERPPLDLDPSTVGTDPAERLAFLMEFATAVRTRLAEIEERYERKTVWLTNRANDVASDLEKLFNRRLDEERRLYLPQRSLGLLLLIIGSILLGIAWFL
jgi:hypothetical protein